MTQIEKDIETKLIRLVAAHGGLCLKWVCPGWSGVPDRIILLPGGRIIFVETKRPKDGRVAPLQRWWGNKLKSFGFDHYIARNEKDLADISRRIEEVML